MHGGSKVITNRSPNSDDMADVINFRLQQHQNEGTQANFETFSNYGHMALGEPLSPLQPANPENKAQAQSGYAPQPQRGDARPVKKQTYPIRATDPQQLGRLLESRSSILIPQGSSQRQESKLYDSTDVIKRNANGEGRASLDSNRSLPYNTDINIEKIQVRQSKDGEVSPKAMRKAATNASIQMSFRAA